MTQYQERWTRYFEASLSSGASVDRAVKKADMACEAEDGRFGPPMDPVVSLVKTSFAGILRLLGDVRVGHGTIEQALNFVVDERDQLVAVLTGAKT